jgi:hypothetical protein
MSAEHEIDAPRAVSFTILINNYNYGRFLAKAIQSALGQTWPHVLNRHGARHSVPTSGNANPKQSAAAAGFGFTKQAQKIPFLCAGFFSGELSVSCRGRA